MTVRFSVLIATILEKNEVEKIWRTAPPITLTPRSLSLRQPPYAAHQAAGSESPELKQLQCQPIHRSRKNAGSKTSQNSRLAGSPSTLTAGLGSRLVSKTVQKRTHLPHARRPTAQAPLHAASARRHRVARPSLRIPGGRLQLRRKASAAV